MVWVGLSVGEALPVLQGDFSPSPPLVCVECWMDIALGEAGSLYTGAALPDPLFRATPRDPVTDRLFPKACLPRPLMATLVYQAKYPFLLLRGQMAGPTAPEARPTCPLYIGAVTVTVGKCGACTPFPDKVCLFLTSLLSLSGALGQPDQNLCRPKGQTLASRRLSFMVFLARARACDASHVSSGLLVAS